MTAIGLGRDYSREKSVEPSAKPPSLL